MSKCGYVAIIGRPNVGKSTLLNHLLGKKLSITSRKPQTTRHRLLGIKTSGDVQTIYIDTPGLHQHGKKALNRHMNRAARQAIVDVDVIVFMVSGLQWQDDDAWVLSLLESAKCPIILAVNKVDNIKHKEKLLPHLQQLSAKHEFSDVIPMSVLANDNLASLEQAIAAYLPQGPHFFPDDSLTDKSSRFLAAEMVREQLTRQLGQELPYALTVVTEQFKKEKNLLRISAVIYVEKSTQKAIVIGDKGQRLKKVGTQARLRMEKFFESKVFLQLWVKVKSSWSDDKRALQQLGFGGE